MHGRNILRCALTAIVASAVIWTACGDDGPTGTGGNGGGGGGNTLSIPAGTYAISIETWTCGEVDTMVLIAGNEVFCEADIVDEFLDFTCPLEISGNTLSLDCELTNEIFQGCTVTSTISGTGTKSGDNYTISGTVTTKAAPQGCVSDECFGFRASIMRVGDAPGACDFASEGEVDATITGGPFAGAQILDASGFSSVLGNAVSFEVFASENSEQPIARTAAQGSRINLNFGTPFIDPATQSLPHVLPVVAEQFGARLMGGQEPARLGYYEFQESPFHNFFADSVLSGSLTVNELSEHHIAGSLNVTVRGMQTSGSSTSVSTRTIVGGYFVLNEEQGPVVMQEMRTTRGMFAQKLRESLVRAIAE